MNSPLDRTLAALADPTRRAIVERLTRGDARVTDVAAPFTMSLAAVSKHVRVLERARLVRRRRVGREHVLSLSLGPLEALDGWIAGTRAHWAARLDALDALLHEDTVAPRRKASR